jgi:integrase
VSPGCHGRRLGRGRQRLQAIHEVGRALRVAAAVKIARPSVLRTSSQLAMFGAVLTLLERQIKVGTEEWEHVYCAAIVAANTSMRPVEVKHLRRCDVDLVKKLLHGRRSKKETSHRVIPLNTSALNALARMFERADILGHT